jgi:hypothetical protein
MALLYPQLHSLWLAERGRTPDLPHRFRNSDVTAGELARRGLRIEDLEFTLSTDRDRDGTPSWIARTRDQEYRVAFALGDASAS